MVTCPLMQSDKRKLKARRARQIRNAAWFPKATSRQVCSHESQTNGSTGKQTQLKIKSKQTKKQNLKTNKRKTPQTLTPSSNKHYKPARLEWSRPACFMAGVGGAGTLRVKGSSQTKQTQLGAGIVPRTLFRVMRTWTCIGMGVSKVHLFDVADTSQCTS